MTTLSFAMHRGMAAAMLIGLGIGAANVTLAMRPAQGQRGGMCANMHVASSVMNLLPLGMEDIAAVQSGMWSDPATWGGILPGPGDDVLIPEDITVTYDINDDGDDTGLDQTRFHFIRVDGGLTWSTAQDTTLYVDTLFNTPNGEIYIGSDIAPIPANIRAEVIIIADALMSDAPLISRGLLLHGSHEIVGADKTDYAALIGDALAGATSVTLAQPPVGWEIGDTLVLGGTFFDPNGSNADNSRFHDEVLTITGINGSTISFENTAPGSIGLLWDHVRPNGTHFSSGDLALYVANLTRNITFRSELDPASPDTPGPDTVSDRRRGHHMVMHTSESITRNAGFYEFGRLNKNEFIDDSGINVDGTAGAGMNVRGRYAFHHHRNLPQDYVPINPLTCEPAVVDGCVVWGSPGWGFVHHDSHCVFENNVAFDVLGASFVQEAGNEIGRWENNIAIKCTGDNDPDMTVEPFGAGFTRVTRFDFGFNGEAYWIQGAGQVELINNIAISAAGGGVSLFSDVDGNDNRDRGWVPREHLPAEIQHIVTNDAGLIAGNRVPANTFTGMEVYNSDFGLITWNHMRNQGSWIGFTCPCDGNVHREYALIDNFSFWNIYGRGVHLQYSSQIEFRNGLIASSDLATPGLDDKPEIDLTINGDGRGYGLGMNGPTKRLVVDNVIIEGWEFGIRTPGEGQINLLDNSEGIGSEGAVGLPDRRSVFRNLRMASNGDHMYRRQNAFSAVQDFSNYLVIEDSDFADDVSNDPPTADFTWESLGPHGVVQLSGLASFDSDTPNGMSPFEPGEGWIDDYSVAVADPNYIVAYAWDLDMDGVIDAFGEVLTTQFPLGISSPVALTVWDHQGATDTVVHNVMPQPGAYPELIIDGDFAIAGYNDGSISSASTDLGWFGAFAALADEAARLDGQYGFAWAGQAMYDDHVRRGQLLLSFDYAIFEGHTSPSNSEISRLQARIWGINSEFDAVYRDFPAPAGAIPYDADLLYEEWFVDPAGWTNVERTIDTGADGYRYYMISFRGTGVDEALGDDYVLVDNVSIVGAGGCSPADMNADGIVGLYELLEVLSCWGSTDPSCSDADVNVNGTSAGVVDLADLLTVLTQWGSCSP